MFLFVIVDMIYTYTDTNESSHAEVSKKQFCIRDQL